MRPAARSAPRRDHGDAIGLRDRHRVPATPSTRTGRAARLPSRVSCRSQARAAALGDHPLVVAMGGHLDQLPGHTPDAAVKLRQRRRARTAFDVPQRFLQTGSRSRSRLIATTLDITKTCREHCANFCSRNVRCGLTRAQCITSPPLGDRRRRRRTRRPARRAAGRSRRFPPAGRTGRRAGRR